MHEDVAELIAANRLAPYLARKYPAQHAIQSDASLYDYTLDLKQRYLRSSSPLHKVVWQNKMDVMQKVLGLHTAVSRVQGGRLKAKAEIRIASLFKGVAPAFLEMVVVHELAHLREFEHNKAFYQLCRHMLPDYDQIEFDLRLLLLQRAIESAGVEEIAANAADDGQVRRAASKLRA
ncbi:YgjP-like metallopeptidase domain-containing protein [Solimonas terrae]|uniref:M48 family metallopeptidase n=1 Tax=Solimonas terrae TaxID=1396819 RepID=A0A6M2BUL8_9GAMM|nr:M48 family metallopeptidase [Solimonas terrae]